MVIAGAGGNFSSGGDVHEIIGPLTEMDMPGLLDFTRMTGDLVKAMRACPQPIVAALDGVCVGAGAIIAMASDIRIATPATKTAFLFTRVGLAGCDMGACAILPRIIGQGRASELLFTGRVMSAEEGERWGFHNRLVAADALLDEAQALAREPRRRPDLRPRHHQDPAQQRMGGEPRDRDRDGGAGPGDLHGDQRFPPRLRGLRGEADAGVRGRLMADRTFLDWPFFDDATGDLAASLRAGAKPSLADAHGDGRRRRMPRAGRASSATAAGCAIACPRLMAASTRRSTSARSP